MHKLVCYISHPVTSHGSVSQNIKRINEIRKAYVRDGRFVPVLPTDIMREVFPLKGNQRRCYDYAIELLLSCDAVHFYGEWSQSTGCMREMKIAVRRGIAVAYSPLTVPPTRPDGKPASLKENGLEPSDPNDDVDEDY